TATSGPAPSCTRSAPTAPTSSWAASRSATRRRCTDMRPAPILFASLFASQAAFLTLSPVLPAMARDLDLPLAAVGQLGTAAGLAGALAAVAITAAGSRLGVRTLLLCGL